MEKGGKKRRKKLKVQIAPAQLGVEQPAPLRPEIDRRALDGWLTEPQLTGLQTQLSAGVARQLIGEAFDSGHPSALATMADNVEQARKRVKRFGSTTAVVLGDGHRAWRRVERAVDDLLRDADDLRRDVDGLLRDVPDLPSSSDLARDVKNLILRQLVSEARQGEALTGVLHDVANYARGRRDPLNLRLGRSLGDNEAAEMLDRLPLDLSTLGLPSPSVIAQAEGVLMGLKDHEVFVGLPTAATQGGDAAVVFGPDRTADEYQRLSETLRSRRAGALLSEAQRIELADVISEARTREVEPRIVTTNWDVMRVLRNLPPAAEPIGPNDAPTQADVQVDGVTLHLFSVASPRNPFPLRSQVSQLASDQFPIQFGQAVRVTFADNKTADGRLYGYTTLGNARVLLDGGEILYALSDTESVASIPDDLVPNFLGVEHPRTQAWEEKRVPLTGDLGRFPEVLEYRDALRDLKTRQVAGRTLSVNQYTDLIRGSGFRSYIVGGATRDILIGKDPKDIDLASTQPVVDTFTAIVSSPDGLGKKGGRQGELEVRRNVPFGVVQVEPSDETGLDILSTHDASGPGASLSLEFDALARDFTVNAVYFDVDGDQIIDPTGRGLDDLQGRLVRFVQGDGKADEVLKKEPVMVARWIKLMSKQDAAGWFFRAAEVGDPAVALKWLVHHADTMEELVRTRFVDRMVANPAEAEARVRRIFELVVAQAEDDGRPLELRDAVAAIQKIYKGPEPTGLE